MSDSSAGPSSDAAATQRWVEHLERFAAGNHTVVAFCAAEGVSQSNFYLWRRRLAQPVTATAIAPSIVPIRVTPPPTPAMPIELTRPSGTVVRFPADTRPEFLIAVLRGLEEPMLTIPPTTKLWFASAVDLRLGFDGLSQLVRTQLAADPLSGHLFVFTNRSANRVKVLYWGGHGLCLWCQRLEAGRYHFPEATAAGIELTAAQFAMILDGIDVSRVRRFKRYSPPPPTTSRYPSA